MIKKIKLINFQSHKSSIINFTPGLNTITGSSDSGKTAILRGLNWCLNNRPTGTSFISYWNRDKKGNPLEETTIVVEKNNKSVARTRSKEFNGYEIFESGKDHTLEALESDSPDEVKSFFNMNEVNVRRQHDAPFLIDETAGEVARFFNRIIRLDIIDRVLSDAESLRKKINQNIELEKTQIEKDTALIDQFSWLENAVELYVKYERRLDKLNESQVKMYDIEWLVDDICEAKESVDTFPDIKKANVLLSESQVFFESVKLKKKSLEFFCDIISDADDLTQYLKRIPDISNVASLISSVDELRKKINKTKETIMSIEDLYISVIMSKTKEVSAIDIEVKELNKQMPVTCPLCGARLKGEK